MSKTEDTYGQIGRAGAIIVILSFADKILALGKEMLIALRFGVSLDLDVFNVAYAFPAITVLLFTGVFASAFVPLYLQWSAHHSTKQADRHALALLYISTLFFLMLSVFCFFLSPFIFSLVGYGFGPEAKPLGVWLERLLVLLIFLDGIGIVFRGLLHAKKRFFALYAAPIFINATLILTLVFGSGIGIYALVLGFLLGTLLKVVAMAVALKMEGFSFFEKPVFERTRLLALVSLALPLLGSELIANSNLLVDQVMATQLSPGSVSTLRYAFRINDLPIQIVIIAISKAIFPFISEKVISGDMEGLKDIFKKTVIFLGFLTLPITCLVVLFSEDIVILILKRGAFDMNAARETGRTFLLYSLGLFFYAYTFVNGTFFSALKNTKPLLHMGILSVFLNVFFNIVFMRFLGTQGIALSTTVTLCIISIRFLTLLKKNLGIQSLSDFYPSLCRLLGASVCMLVLGLLLQRGAHLLDINRLIYLPAIFLATGAFYLLLIRLFATSELNMCLNLALRPLSFLHDLARRFV